jgi:hypothetical protein
LAEEPSTLDWPRIEEASVVARVTRYSCLRGVERALLPSVRRRRQLPTTVLGVDLLGRLQKLLERVRANAFADEVDVEEAEVALAEIDETLENYSSQLLAMIRETPLSELSSSLPSVVDTSRSEVVALLDLCLDDAAPGPSGESQKRIDFLITLLSKQRIRGVATLKCDPSKVTIGVARHCGAHDAIADYRGIEYARIFRDATMELLGLDNLNEIIARIDGVKQELGDCLFDREVLRALVAFNLAAENRFRELFELEHLQDLALDRTLRALTELDSEAPEIAQTARLRGALGSPGMRALEEAIRERLSGTDRATDVARRLARSIDLSRLEGTDVDALVNPEEDLTGALTRAAVVVGLTLRDLPSLTERLHELDIDVTRMKTDWVKELDQALQSAIQTLTLAGRSEEAMRLSRTRMRFLSGS